MYVLWIWEARVVIRGGGEVEFGDEWPRRRP